MSRMVTAVQAFAQMVCVLTALIVQTEALILAIMANCAAITAPVAMNILTVKDAAVEEILITARMTVNVPLVEGAFHTWWMEMVMISDQRSVSLQAPIVSSLETPQIVALLAL